MRIRYIVSIVPALALLSIYGLHNIYTFISQKFTSRTLQQLTVFLIASSILLYNGKYLADQFVKINPTPYLKGEITREEYIQKYRPEYATIQFANSILNSNDKVLCLFLGKRGYYMNFTPTFEMPYKKGIISALISDSENETLGNNLLKNNYKHLLLRNNLTKSWIDGLPTSKRKILVAFFRSNEVLYSNSGYTLLKITTQL